MKRIFEYDIKDTDLPCNAGEYLKKNRLLPSDSGAAEKNRKRDFGK